MLTIHATPLLHDPVLLCAFSGWADAAFAASGAMRYLGDKFPGQLIAEFDPDEVYSYTITRPLAAFTAPGRRTLRWPHLRWIAQRLPQQPHDLVLLTGPEPDLRWKACVGAVAQFAQRLGIRRAIALGAFYAAVPHFGAPMMIGYASDPEWRARLLSLRVGESSYEGPTGFLSAVIAAAQDAGIATAACWAAAPSYLSGTNNPKLAAALLGIVERLLDQPISRTELQTAGREMENQIEEVLRGRPHLVEFIQRLSAAAQSNDTPAPQTGPQVAPPEPQSQLPEPGELPTAEEVLRDLEEHLRRLRKQPPEDG